MKLRKKLHPFGVRTDIRVDISKLLAELQASGALDQGWTAASMDHGDEENLFVKANSWSKVNFDGGSDEFYTEVNLAKPNFTSSELSGEDLKRRDNMIYRVKRTQVGSKDYSEHADVINPYEMDEQFNVPELQAIWERLVGKVGRVRIAKLKAGHKVNPHIDYDPAYVWRYHLPLQTNDDSHVFYAKDKTVFKTHFPSDGRLFWLNAGVIHWVENNGPTDRIHLLIDVGGEEEYTANQDKMEFFPGDNMGKYTDDQ